MTRSSPPNRRQHIRPATGLSLAVSPLGFLGVAQPAFAAAPPNSISYYVTGYSTSWAYNAGCSLGQLDLGRPGTQRSVAVLDFGAMW